ncbi:DUF4153 domain-containing protein [Microtetraspora niveoalba]|uniref:DUF4153 domain-containing protein n=1 Tax=Microtetraspora niveoalba TaxID=46175 RepID=UPI000A004604|nr:DUF4153 domain-containing protein [Microtetraspora niveoalba]
MRPLDFLGRIKVKLGIVIVLAVVAAFVVNEVGINSGLSRDIRIAIAVVLALIMVQLLARGMTKPLREMAAAAQTIAKGRYGMRVSATSRDEVGELARAFNAMAADLGEVDRQRRELVANVSHELRTPITGLQAVLENVVDGVSPPDVDTLGTALAQTQRLGRLVAQLLDLSRLDSGARLIEPETLDLVSLCRQAAGEAALARDDVIVESDVPPGARLVADPGLLAQVLANLLDNAVRHSPPGGTVRLTARASGTDMMEVAVVDAGPGIPASERARVFERFSRLDAGRAADAGGAGLGLAIAKEIVELHGGRIRITDGPGCHMVIELPGLARPPASGTAGASGALVSSGSTGTASAGTAGERGAFVSSGGAGTASSGDSAADASVGTLGAASGRALAPAGIRPAPAPHGIASHAAEGSAAEESASEGSATGDPEPGRLMAGVTAPDAAGGSAAEVGVGAVPVTGTAVAGVPVSGRPESRTLMSEVPGSELSEAREVPEVREVHEVHEAAVEVCEVREVREIREVLEVCEAVEVRDVWEAIEGTEGPVVLGHEVLAAGLVGPGLLGAGVHGAGVHEAGVHEHLRAEVPAYETLGAEVPGHGVPGAEGPGVDVHGDGGPGLAAPEPATPEPGRGRSGDFRAGASRSDDFRAGASRSDDSRAGTSRSGDFRSDDSGADGSGVDGSGAESSPSEGGRPPEPPVYVPPSLFPRPELPRAPRWMLPAAAVGGLVASVATPYAPMGLGIVVAAVSLGTAAFLTLLPTARHRFTPWTVGFGLLAYALVSVAIFRDADWLVTPLLLAAFGVASLGLSGAGAGWLGVIRGGLSVLLALPPLPWFLSAPAKRLFKGRWLLSALASAGLTVVLLGVFGLLFSSADAVFSTFARELLRAPDWTADLPYRMVLFAVFGLLVVAAVLVGLRPVAEPEPPNLRAPVSRMVWVVPLAGLNLLFASFVAVQITVLFGGSRRVISTAGLTYAEYARSGFFELVTVSVFVLGVVAAAVVFLHLKGAADRWLLAGLLGPLCAFTLVILASALHRLDLYTGAYGVSRLRAIVEATLWWLAAVFVLVLVAGAVRLARHGTAWFSRTLVLVTGLSLLAFAVGNPEARVAETQLSVRGVTRLDHAYLAGLAAEAVPVLDRLPEPLRSCVLRDVVAENRLDRPDPWNGWNLAREQARDVLRRHPVRADVECPDRTERFSY